MNKNQIRKKRVRLQAERREILRKIDELQAELNSTKDKSKRLKLQEEIIRLGEQLQQKVISSVPDHTNKNNKLFKEVGRELGNKNKAFSMDYGEYVKYKKQHLSDPKIADLVGATVGQITAWKHRNGITQEKWKEAN